MGQKPTKFQRTLAATGLEPRSGWQYDRWWLMYQTGRLVAHIHIRLMPSYWKQRRLLRKLEQLVAGLEKKTDNLEKEIADSCNRRT